MYLKNIKYEQEYGVVADLCDQSEWESEEEAGGFSLRRETWISQDIFSDSVMMIMLLHNAY